MHTFTIGITAIWKTISLVLDLDSPISRDDDNYTTGSLYVIHARRPDQVLINQLPVV